jgi:hypothetical protein
MHLVGGLRVLSRNHAIRRRDTEYLTRQDRDVDGSDQQTHLIVDVANRLQREGHAKRSRLSLRQASGAPDPDDDAAMVLGVVPLLSRPAQARWRALPWGW